MDKKRLSFFILTAVLIGAIVGVLVWTILSPKLGEGIFYYRLSGDKANLFLLGSKDEGEKIVAVAAQEVDLGKYKPPRHSFISPDGKQLIYFKKLKEEEIKDLGDGMVASRIFYEPILINLKTGTEKKIEQPIDSTSVVFSSDSNSIAWIKEVGESTHEELDESQKKRELWLSRIDGENAQLLAEFDENVILLEKWSEDYIYFQGISGASAKSLGRINIETKKISYVMPKDCGTDLINCQNIELSPLGKMFLYEIYTKNENREITELYLGNFETRQFKPVLTTDRISDKVWLENEKGFFYTEQEMVKNEGLKETIHLVDLYKETDKILYSGSYISQLTLDNPGNYLYFLEQAEGNEVNMFELIRLNIKNKEAKTVLTENYNNILLIQ